MSQSLLICKNHTVFSVSWHKKNVPDAAGWVSPHAPVRGAQLSASFLKKASFPGGEASRGERCQASPCHQPGPFPPGGLLPAFQYVSSRCRSGTCRPLGPSPHSPQLRVLGAACAGGAASPLPRPPKGRALAELLSPAPSTQLPVLASAEPGHVLADTLFFYCATFETFFTSKNTYVKCGHLGTWSVQ